MKFTIDAVAPQGYPITLSLEGERGATLMPEAWAAMEWLKGKGFTAPPIQAMPIANGNEQQPETKICPLHHVAMRRRSGKGGDSWYSHKAINPDTQKEYWCRGEDK